MAVTVETAPFVDKMISEAPLHDDGRPICISTKTGEPMVVGCEDVARQFSRGMCMLVFAWGGVFRGLSSTAFGALMADPEAHGGGDRLLRAAAMRATPLEAAPIERLRARPGPGERTADAVMEGLAMEHARRSGDGALQCMLAADSSPFALAAENLEHTCHRITSLGDINTLVDAIETCKRDGVPAHITMDFASMPGMMGTDGITDAIGGIMRVFRRDPNRRHAGLVTWPCRSGHRAELLSVAGTLECAAGSGHQARVLERAMADGIGTIDVVLVYVTC